MSADGLRARIRLSRGDFHLDLALDVPGGEVVALLGPNGSGKSTALGALAGLLAVDAGKVELDGRLLDDGAGVFVPPERRSAAVVFQDYLLFAHLSALDNVAFGPRARGASRREARRRAAVLLERFDLADLASTRPDRLSGGQAQRVALARALATEPRLLLLDEPLAALDAASRVQVRAELRHRLADVEAAVVVVTHDPVDAMVMADRVVVLEAGVVVQQGPPTEVARAPRTRYVARLVGLNLYRGRSDGTGVALDGGGRLVTSSPVAGEVMVAFPPAAVALHGERPHGSVRNAWPGRVAALEQHAETVRVSVDAVPPVLADVTPAAVADLDLRVGASVWAAVKATEVRSYPA